MKFKFSMLNVQSNQLIKAALLLFVFANLTQASFSQDSENTVENINLSGFLSITNNGIAVVPALSLGESAGILGFSAGNRFRLS